MNDDHAELLAALNERLGPGPLMVQVFTIAGRRAPVWTGLLATAVFLGGFPVLIVLPALMGPTDTPAELWMRIGGVVGIALLWMVLYATLVRPAEVTVVYEGDADRVLWSGERRSLLSAHHPAISMDLVLEALDEARQAQLARAGAAGGSGGSAENVASVEAFLADTPTSPPSQG